MHLSANIIQVMCTECNSSDIIISSVSKTDNGKDAYIDMRCRDCNHSDTLHFEWKDETLILTMQ